MPPFDPAPRDLEAVLEPAWLSRALAPHLGGAHVVEVVVVELLATQATKVRLALRFDGDESGLPAHICIKGVLTDTGCPTAASLGETRFYRDMAACLPVRVPDCLYAGFSEHQDNGVIIMRDIKAAGGLFMTALVPLAPDDARDTLSQIAALHAATWNGSAPYAQGWMGRFLDRMALDGLLPADTLQDLLDGDRGAPLPVEIKDAARLQRALALLARQGHAEPNCLVHGDAHAGNLYRDAGGIGIVDWQIFQQGEWALDIAYHVASVLTPEDRRIHECGLLDHYRHELKAKGGPDLDRDHAWVRYRSAMLYGYYLWTITRKVEAPVILEFVRRLGLAVADLDSFALVERSATTAAA